MTVVTQEMINAYNAEFDKRPLSSVNKMPLVSAHSHAKDEIINRHRTLPTDRILVQKRMELSQYEFDSVVKALRLLCELEYKGNTDRFCELHHFVHTGIDENVGIEINVYDDGYPTQYGFADDDPVVCVACYHHDCDTDVTDWGYALASFVVHKDFFKPSASDSEQVCKPSASDSEQVCKPSAGDSEQVCKPTNAPTQEQPSMTQNAHNFVCGFGKECKTTNGAKV